MKDAPARLTWRLRLFACSVLLTGVAFVSAPGEIVADTKLDQAVEPGLYLARTLHLWDPTAGFGQVQNQAYGYLFPMGPFFWLGSSLGIEPWIVQRLWWALVLVVAFLGLVKLAGSLGIGSPWFRILGGLAYALSPRMLTNLGPISIEVWPLALAPWVLLPLVLGSRRGSPVRAAALSAVAVGCVGGVNAVATSAVLPLGVLWLLTRERGPRRRSLMVWWPTFVAVATLWWVVPLLLLGRHSPEFLDYIESAQTTTLTSSLGDALRGTTKWVPYLSNVSGPGNSFLVEPLLILNTGLLMAFGVAGLARRGMPHRRFLLAGLLTGLVLLTLGHLGAVEGFGSAYLHNALDGVLAPFRNLHKYDAVVRIPIVLGMVSLLSSIVARSRQASARARPSESGAPGARPSLGAAGAVVLAVVLVFGASTPAWSGQLSPRGSFPSLPGYWQETVDYLADNDDGRRALLVPGEDFGDYLWGTTNDEVLQALARSPWATRNVVPLAPGSNIRMLDAIEQRLVSGVGSQALADYLRRAGIGYLVVRNDVRPRTDVPGMARVYQSITDTPGLERVAGFGPEVGGESVLDGGEIGPVHVNGGWQAWHTAVEVYRIDPDPAGDAVVAFDSDDVPAVVGDSATLLRLGEAGVLTDQPTQLAPDVRGTPSSVVLTDGARRQEVTFGRVHENRSTTLTAEDRWKVDRPAHDYATSGDSGRWRTAAMVEGARSITATTSASDADYLGQMEPSRAPYAAFDGDPDTFWQSGFAVDGEHAVELGLTTPREVREVVLSSPRVPGARGRDVVVTTDAGSRTARLVPGTTVTVPLFGGETRFVRVSTDRDLTSPLRLSEVTIAGVAVRRPLVLPSLPKGWPAPSQILLSTDARERPGCLTVDGETRCRELSERLGEDGRRIDRLVSLPAAESFDADLRAVPWGGEELEELAQRGREVRATTSSRATHGLASSGLAAVDLDDGTGWIASAFDPDPTLTLRWRDPSVVSQIAIRNDENLPATTPTRATLRFDDGSVREVTLGTKRPVSFKRVRGVRSVEVHLDAPRLSRGLSDLGDSGALGLGVSEISLPGRGPDVGALLGDTSREYRCGTGPTVEVDGVRRETALVASQRQLFSGAPVPARLCGDGPVTLTAGPSRVLAEASPYARPSTLVLQRQALAANGARPAALQRWEATSRQVEVPSGQALLNVRENQNSGWVAERDGERLTAMTIDGWQQAWATPGGGEVTLEFVPDRAYRAAIFGGLGLLALFLALAASPLLRRLGASAAPLGAARVWPWFAGALAAGALLLIGGTSALLAAGAGAGVAVLVRRRSTSPLVPLALAASLLCALVLAYALRPHGGTEIEAWRMAWPQWLALASLGVVTATCLEDLRGRRRTRPRLRLRARSSGRSTSS
ncbi:DUF3367 domain-containing protein [Mumia sp. zg.B53]|uniref:alpha-(1->3)-arabinofuranosyltransferase domain-containing protein n=1 Tax=Mumia sp. zg.B53 TaxID=2855449 RepID=UPI001C6EAF44|nr:alpha-(1->3)-arabinofuranosyltransferase family protein [Mumia sp. zg.B53]MBW9216701.1 DUF3367 domain-containing protein [Mumia sp. zg.B53]